MGNMSYCRFENTYHDLVDCEEHLSDTELNPTEEEYRGNLIELCKTIAGEWE